VKDDTRVGFYKHPHEKSDSLSNVLTRRVNTNRIGSPSEGCSVLVCEYQFENFNALGNDAYLDQFAQRLDELFACGWMLLGSKKDAVFRGWWQMELAKGEIKDLERGSGSCKS